MKKPPQRPKGQKPVWEKMSKSKGNVVRPEEVVFGVSDLDRDYEFRDVEGDVIDYKAWGVWRDRFGSVYDKHVPNAERKPMLFYTSTIYKNQPVFLHRKGNPIPALFRDDDGFEYAQHQYLTRWWVMMLDKYEFSPFKYENLLDHIGYYDELPIFNQLRQVLRVRAYLLWEKDPDSGGDADHFWFEAERQLFKGLTKEGGYVVSICDRTLEENQGFHHHWSLRHVSPKGVREYRLKKVDS